MCIKLGKDEPKKADIKENKEFHAHKYITS